MIMTLPQRTNAAKDQARRPRQRERSRGRAKRREGLIYDVIDEWLATSFARWIASKDSRPNHENSEGAKRGKSTYHEY
jgi:hypothetical protein